jgi:hypothetical protein
MGLGIDRNPMCVETKRERMVKSLKGQRGRAVYDCNWTRPVGDTLEMFCSDVSQMFKFLSNLEPHLAFSVVGRKVKVAIGRWEGIWMV